MKKYYIMFGGVGAAFMFCLAVLILNPRSTTALNPYLRQPQPSSFAGDLIAIIGLIILAAVIAAVIIYRIYKLCRRIIAKAKKKDDTHLFTPDAEELYTKSQSSENISKWMISTRQGYLDNNNKNKRS